MSPGEIILNGSLVAAMPLALIAGIISFISPCVLPLIPGYLGYISGVADGGAKKSRPRGDWIRQCRRHTNHRQSSAIVQALPVLTTGPRLGSTSLRACAACHSSQCKQAGVADSENPPFAVVTCTSSPGPSRPYRASRGAPISPSRSVNRICLSGLRWRQRRG